MAEKLKLITPTRSFEDTTTALGVFITAMAITDTVSAFQIVMVGEDPSTIWQCVVIWNDNV